jgi:hypothetical protein
LHLSPQEEVEIRAEFERLANMTNTELRSWLDRPESRRVGWTRKGETESVGRQSALRILAIRDKTAADLTDADYRHMRKVIGFCRRHLAQRPWGDVTDTRWRWSLMNWAHDPVKPRKDG